MNNYILVGTPNCGKTTIFNAITGQKEKVGNWHGVTAKAKKGGYISKNSSFSVVDLPGIYSLSTYSCEEKVTVEYILKGEYNAIVLVVDASCPYGAITLFKELVKLNKKIILLFNKSNKVELNKEQLIKDKIQYYEINPYNKKSVKNFVDNIYYLNGNKGEISLEHFKNKPKKFYDKNLLKWYVLLPIFFTVVFLSYFIAFSGFLGGGLSKVLSSGIETLAQMVLQLKVSNFISVILYKTITSLSGVISLIPQVVILQICLFIIEESGLSCRFCVIVYNALSKIGLSGKSLFPLISSLGCGAVSVKTCNACENLCVKNSTINLTAFVPCSAKNSVVIFICLNCFNKPYLVMFLAYLSLLIITFSYAYICQKVKKSVKEDMFIELVDISFPNFKRVILQGVDALVDFFKKIISTCLIICFALALFTSVTPKLTIANSVQDSIICLICKRLVFILKPIGITDWKILLSFTLGLFAKEGVVSSFCSLYTGGLNFGYKTGIILLFITLVYPPCLTHIIAIEKEQKFLGLKIFIKHLLFAYIGALLLNLTL